MNLIAGSYEKFIWGFKLKQLKSTSDHALALQPVFSYPSHLAPITTIAIAGPVAVSGSSDDTIQLYDVSAATSLGCLHHHTSSITSLSFFVPSSVPSPRNLIAATAGGEVLIFDADPFVLLKTIKRVHKRDVADMAIHPSGRLALTVGRDQCLALVNMVRGRRSFCCKLEKEASLVKFDSLGEKFYMIMGDSIGIHESEDARLISSFECPKRVLCAHPGKVGPPLTCYHWLYALALASSCIPSFILII